MLVIITCVGGYAQIINPGGGGGSGTVGANNGTAGCVANYAAAGGSTTVGPDANLCDAGLGVWNAAIITLNFTGAGGPVITTPATNTDLTFTPNGTGGVVFPAGAATCAAIKFAGDTACGGIYRSGTTVYSATNGTTPNTTFGAGVGYRTGSTNAFGWSSTTNSTGAFDTCSHRSAAGIIGFDTDSACSNGQAKLKAAAYISTGTTFTSNAGCTESALTGGATAGKFTVGQGTACTIILTMGNTATAVNGWTCLAYDQTAVPAVAIRQTASTTTTCSLLMTVATSDVITFAAMGY